MADIIELQKRRQRQECEKAEALRDEKIDLLKKIFQCTRCQLRCSRCGTQIQEAEDRTQAKLPYPLCTGCREEYDIYLKQRRGDITEGHYWHNEEWMKVWGTWLEHQRALDHYRNSKEFIKLLHEFENLW
ncbi:MAG: hypothetical protein JSU72_01950 [Deltaproteobacteria bacterium]|nr:MAG: hypothetical protein JSU72_01950 [Deltaproteobacteria bacterium]